MIRYYLRAMCRPMSIESVNDYDLCFSYSLEPQKDSIVTYPVEIWPEIQMPAQMRDPLLQVVLHLDYISYKMTG